MLKLQQRPPCSETRTRVARLVSVLEFRRYQFFFPDDRKSEMKEKTWCAAGKKRDTPVREGQGACLLTGPCASKVVSISLPPRSSAGEPERGVALHRGCVLDSRRKQTRQRHRGVRESQKARTKAG